MVLGLHVPGCACHCVICTPTSLLVCCPAASAAPLTGNYTPDLGRTPMAAKDPTLLNAAQGAGYELKEGDKPFQQQEKKGWFPW